MTSTFDGKVGFAIGTGRCGTHFMYKVIGLESDVSSVHERNPLNECFHRYCKWYKLPVDDEGFLRTKEREIGQDLKVHRFSFESSAYLSLSVPELHSRFGAKFVLLVRSPERVVISLLRKGWYEDPITWANPQLALGYQDLPSFHHFLGRIVPSGEKFLEWNRMSRVGKLAWYWSAVNASVLDRFLELPEAHRRIEKLEELTFDRYREISQFLGFDSTIKQDQYDDLVRQQPAAYTNLSTVADWNAREIGEFEAEVGPTAQRLGYDYRVDRLPVASPRRPSTKQRMAKTLRQLTRPVKRLANEFWKS